jgi:hypothetical protein
MPFDINDLADLGMNLFLVGMFCCAPLIVITGIIWSAVTNHRQLKAGELLAPELGLRVQTPGAHPTRTWYLGSHRGREYLLRTYATISHSYYDGRRRRSMSANLQFIMPIRTGEPLEVKARLGPKRMGRADYDTTFVGLGVERLNAAGKRALYAFAKKGLPRGLSRNLTLRIGRGWRSVGIVSRDELLNIMGQDAGQFLPQADGYLLVHDPDAGMSPEKVRAVLDDMDETARTIETGRPSRILDPDQIPDEGFISKYSSWIFIGLFVFVFPAVLCICVSTLVGLGGG